MSNDPFLVSHGKGSFRVVRSRGWLSLADFEKMAKIVREKGFDPETVKVVEARL